MGLDPDPNTLVVLGETFTNTPKIAMAVAKIAV